MVLAALVSLSMLGSSAAYAAPDPGSGPPTGGATVTIPTPAPETPSDFTHIAAGFNHSLALDADGNIYAWGDNDYGQLGNGNTTRQSTPVKLTITSQPTNVKFSHITAGSNHSVALSEDGKLYA